MAYSKRPGSLPESQIQPSYDLLKADFLLVGIGYGHRRLRLTLAVTILGHDKQFQIRLQILKPCYQEKLKW